MSNTIRSKAYRCFRRPKTLNYNRLTFIVLDEFRENSIPIRHKYLIKKPTAWDDIGISSRREGRDRSK